MNWMGGKRSRAKATSEETLKQRQFFERQRRIRAHKMYTGSFPVTTPTTAAAAASSSSSWPQGKATVTTASSSSWNPLSTSVPSHDIAAAGAKRPLPSPSPLHDTRTPKKMPNRGTAEYDALRLECLARLQTELDWRGKEFALMAYASRIVSSTPQVRVPESGSNRSGSSSSRASSLCGDDSTRASIQRQPHHHHRDSHSHRHHRYDDQSHRHHANELISSHGAIVGLHPAQKGPAEGRESGTDQQQQESDSQSSRFSPTPDKEQLLWRGCYQSIVAKATPELHPAEEKEEEEQEEEKNEADQQKQRSVLVAAVQQPQLAEGPANSNGATHDHIVDPLYDNDEVNNTDDEGEEDEPLIMPTRHAVNCARATLRRSLGVGPAEALPWRHNQGLVPQTLSPDSEGQSINAVSHTQPPQDPFTLSVSNSHVEGKGVGQERGGKGGDDDGEEQVKIDEFKAYQGVARSDTTAPLPPLFGPALSTTDNCPLYVSDRPQDQEGEPPSQWIEEDKAEDKANAKLKEGPAVALTIPLSGIDKDLIEHSDSVRRDLGIHVAPVGHEGITLSEESRPGSSICSFSGILWTWDEDRQESRLSDHIETGEEGERRVVPGAPDMELTFPYSSSSMVSCMEGWSEELVQAAMNCVEHEQDYQIMGRGSMSKPHQRPIGMQETSPIIDVVKEEEEEEEQKQKGQDQGQQGHVGRSNNVDALLWARSVKREDEFLRELANPPLAPKPRHGALTMDYSVTGIDIIHNNSETPTTILGSPSECLEMSELCTTDLEAMVSNAGHYSHFLPSNQKVDGPMVCSGEVVGGVEEEEATLDHSVVSPFSQSILEIASSPERSINMHERMSQFRHRGMFGRVRSCSLRGHVETKEVDDQRSIQSEDWLEVLSLGASQES